jgi:AraC family transcriptional regulator
MSSMVVLRAGEFFGVRPIERSVDRFTLGLRDADPHRAVTRHTHEDAHFVLVLAGDYHHSAAGGRSAATRTCIYNPPGTTHRDHFAVRDGRFAGRFLSLSIAPSSREELGLAEGVSRVVLDPQAVALAGRLARECELWHDYSAVVAESIAYDLVSRLGADRSDRSAAPPSWLYRAVERLLDVTCTPVSIRALAVDAGVHPVHLARVFRQHLGCTPSDVQRQARVRQASALLRATQRSIAEVAAEVGFADQSHLTRAMRAQLGVTPREARRSATWRRR